MTGPSYIGSRSANPEQETYGYLVTGVSQQQLAFVGSLGTTRGSARISERGKQQTAADRHRQSIFDDRMNARILLHHDTGANSAAVPTLRQECA